MSAAEYFGGRGAQALETIERVLAANPGLVVARLLRIAALSSLAREDEAKAAAVALLDEVPYITLSRVARPSHSLTRASVSAISQCSAEPAPRTEERGLGGEPPAPAIRDSWCSLPRGGRRGGRGKGWRRRKGVWSS